VGPFPFDVPVPVNYRVYNKTDGAYVRFVLTEGPSPGGTNRLSPLDQLVLFEPAPESGRLVPTWLVFFINKTGEPPDTIYALGEGDRLEIRTTKPFRRDDLFEFSTELPEVVLENPDPGVNLLDRIRVVPNPYVTASQFEPPLNPGITSGRGERKIDFIHLPQDAVINVFTSRGDHVITLRHTGNIEDGTVSWNLKTKENLDIAYGVYFYVVESPAGNKTGKIAIIK
jgi:hypothetical protein